MSDNVQKAIRVINKRLFDLRTKLQEAASSVKSASTSEAGASQSYTEQDIASIRVAIADLERAKQSLLNHGRRRCISPNFVPNH